MSGNGDEFDPEEDDPRRDRTPDIPEDVDETPELPEIPEEDEGETLPEDLQPPENLDEGIDIDPTGVPRSLERFIVEQPDGDVRVGVDHGGKQRTVEPRDIFPFEEDLVDYLVEDKTDKNRRGANIPIKGPWIHGWLKAKGRDYIANIFRNYQLFLKFVEGRTKLMTNRSTVQRKPGTYDSMYTYLLILEKLDLVERFKREEIPDDEFDHPVPDEFQDRTFLRVTTDFSEAPEQWRNPFKAKYPDTFDEDIEEPEELEEPDEDDEDEEPEETEEDEDDDQEDGEITIDELNTIDDFDDPTTLLNIVQPRFEAALPVAIDDPPVPGIAELRDEDEYDMGRLAVYGVWAEGDADPPNSTLKMLIEIKSKETAPTPGYITTGVASRVEGNLNSEQNPAPKVFGNYDVQAEFSNDFDSRIAILVEENQDTDEYYEVRKEEFVQV